jgi:hypothetical protein
MRINKCLPLLKPIGAGALLKSASELNAENVEIDLMMR